MREILSQRITPIGRDIDLYSIMRFLLGILVSIESALHLIYAYLMNNRIFFQDVPFIT